MFSVFIEWGGQLVRLTRGYASHDAAEWAVAQWMARHGVVESLNPFTVVADEADAPVPAARPAGSQWDGGDPELEALQAYERRCDLGQR